MNMHISKIFVLCMVIGAFGVGTAMAAPSVTIEPASTTGLSPGGTFSINISVDPDGNGVSCGEICLSFDTAVLEVTDLTAGDMLGTDALSAGSGKDNTAGTVTAVLARVGVTTPPTAAGTWATVTFQVKTGAADGTTTIAITSVDLTDESVVDDITGITTTNGTATVGTPSEPSVTIEPASTTGLSPGGTFSINISVDPDGNGVSCGEICLSFDTAVLEVTNRVKGDMLGTDALSAGSGKDNTAGTVTAVLARVGVTTPPTAAGTWATVTFQVKTGAADGTTTIAITSVDLTDESVVDDITGIITTNGTATIGGAAAAPTLITYTITNTTITPPQTTSIDVEFSERVSAIIKIEDASGNHVKELYTSSGVTDPGPKTWDGTYTDGTTVPDATYIVNVSGVSTATTLSVVNTSKTITVSSAANQPPTAVIASPTASGTYHEGTEVSFLSTGSTDPDGTIEAYTWDFGDGSTGTGVSTTHTYTTNGSMTVTLTVTDNESATDTETVTINVLPAGAVVVHLYTGWNLIAVPVNDTSANAAAGLASMIDGCKEVVMWNVSAQTYDPYSKVVDTWTGTDFAITGGMGIFVNVEDATTVIFTGGAWS